MAEERGGEKQDRGIKAKRDINPLWYKIDKQPKIICNFGGKYGHSFALTVESMIYKKY